MVVRDIDTIRLARVVNIDLAANTCELRFFDSFGTQRTQVQLTHPYMGRGWGILTGVEVGSLALVGREFSGSQRILCYLPQPHFFRPDVNSLSDVGLDESRYRQTQSGEIVLQSKPNSAVALNNLGDVVLETSDGNSIEIDKESDLIYQQSAHRRTLCDAGQLDAGTVRRDVRSLQERELDVLFGGVTNFGFSLDMFIETIGVDPQYPEVSKKGGKSQSTSQYLIPGLFDPFFPPKLEAGGGMQPNITDMLNPAVTEHRAITFEFSDGNPGIELPLLDDRAKRRGHIEPNHIAETTIGTLTNDVGRQIRFDYAFGSSIKAGKLSFSKGHNRIWKTQENTTADSYDRFFSIDNTLKGLRSKKEENSPTTAPGHNQGSEWTVDSISQAKTSVLFSKILHTRGTDNFGRKETDLSIPYRSGEEDQINTATSNSFSGSLWTFQVDKEGLTKINIPGATDIGGLEPYRAGRSVLMNCDGDITMSIGKQKATGEQGIDRLTLPDGTPDFLNRNNYPNYGRKDRSLTLDLEGNLETHIGADNNCNQSVIAQLDGSIALCVGKEGARGVTERGGVPANVQNSFDEPITDAAKASTRTGRSLTARFAGNIELEVGHDTEAAQSIIISTTGGNTMHLNKDRESKSLEVTTQGGIDIHIQGPMSKGGYALHIDANGIMHIHATGDIVVATDKVCHIEAKQDINVVSSANIKMKAAKNFEVIAGGMINMTAPTIALNDGKGDAVQVKSGGVDVTTTGMHTIIAPGTVSIMGGLGVAGQFLAQGVPGVPAMPLARVGDLVQVGPALGQIVTGSQFSKSI